MEKKNKNTGKNVFFEKILNQLTKRVLYIILFISIFIFEFALLSLVTGNLALIEMLSIWNIAFDPLVLSIVLIVIALVTGTLILNAILTINRRTKEDLNIVLFVAIYLLGITTLTYALLPVSEFSRNAFTWATIVIFLINGGLTLIFAYRDFLI